MTQSAYDHSIASPWSVAIDESSEGKDWLLEIDSPHVYLTVRVADLFILSRAVDLLNSALAIPSPGQKSAFLPNRDEIVFGRFGESPVSLLRDNEDFPRCFLVIEQQPE